MKREPFINLIRSIWDCFFNRFPGDGLKIACDDAKMVILCWWRKE